MAILIKGKFKGTNYKIHQWCNDWFMLENGKIVSPLTLKLTIDEIKMIRNHKNNGIMFNLFTLSDEGIFKRKKRK